MRPTGKTLGIIASPCVSHRHKYLETHRAGMRNALSLKFHPPYILQTEKAPALIALSQIHAQQRRSSQPVGGGFNQECGLFACVVPPRRSFEGLFLSWCVYFIPTGTSPTCCEVFQLIILKMLVFISYMCFIAYVDGLAYMYIYDLIIYRWVRIISVWVRFELNIATEYLHIIHSYCLYNCNCSS